MIKDYDEENDILFLRWSDKEYEVSEEIENIVLDKSKDGEIIGIEIFNLKKMIDLKENK